MTRSTRLAELADLDTIIDIVTRAYRGTGDDAGWTTESHLLDGERTNPVEVEAAITSEGGLILAVERDGHGSETIIGCIRVERTQIDEGSDTTDAHFGLFAVDPRRQSDGTGAFLLGAAEAQARAWGCTTLTMEVVHQRDDLQAWYLRKGFARTGETLAFPYGDERFGLPRTDDLYFDVLRKQL